MHIKELVLENFKSFGRKTRIPLFDDFTTISGPNGSGKSNIIDGVLFALGLARTRGIRARKLTDLIYNPGHDDDASDRSGTGPSEASVTVVLDNADETIDRSTVVAAAGSEDVGDCDEITVRRRVKETENNYYSYYYLNGRSVNLSDVRELLAGAGVTPEGYNVVMQGDVTEIISMTPRERREIIDEIAGVAEFDAKRDDALDELETVRDRIEEAQLRIDEKRNRLDRLAAERETALDYQDLGERKDEYEGYLKAAELEEKRENLAEAAASVAELEAELEDRRRAFDRRQGTVTRLEEDLEDIDAEIERKGEDEQLRLKSEIEEIKGEIARIEDRIDTARTTAKEAESKRRQAFVEIDRKNETIEELEAKTRETKVEASSLKAEIQDRKAELAEVEAAIENADTEFDELRDDLEERKSTLEDEKTEKNDLQRQKDRLLDEARRRSKRIEETKRELEAARGSVPDLEAEVTDVENELEKARTNRKQIDGVVEDLKREKRELSDDLAEVEDDINAEQQRYAELEANAGRNGDSSFGRAVSTVLGADIDGVHGAVAQLGSVPSTYATACETAAGGRMANVVVDDDGVGQTGIEYLKRHNAGRATFLPMSEMDVRRLPGLPSHPGVVDFAYDLVDFEDRYAGVFSYVLGSTLVVEDVATARELMGEYRMVTLEGELIETSGAMTGGSGGGSRYSFSKSGKGQLERVAERIQALEDRRTELRESVRAVEDRLDDARDRRSQAADAVRDLEAERDEATTDLEDARARVDALEDELRELRDERKDVERRMSEVDDAIADRVAAIESVEADIAELEAELEDSAIPELTAEADELGEEIADLRERLDDLQGRRNELELEKEYTEAAVDDLHDDIETAQNTKAGAEDRIERLEAEKEEEKTRLEQKRKAVADIEDELVELKTKRKDRREDLRKAREQRDEAKDRLTTVEADLTEARERRDTLEWEVDELESEVGEYDPESVPDHHQVRSEIGRIEAKMEALEPVNMLAIEEYDEVEKDLEAIEDGKTTLEDERAAIRDRIDRYEAEKKESFMQAFSGIDDHFGRVFARLSGGTGTLHLEDESDPFEGGLTMKARPEDKPIQRLEAMSGGEKSLTALAFIFAIQRYSPAPFYALDEVDAFLDAANAERVGEMVDDLAGNAQFVVVTHRSAMLDRSERAIGVTMSEDNTSAVTGIRLGTDGEEVPADD